MAATRKPRVPLQEQIRLINECRKSDMTDADWCRENDIPRVLLISSNQIPAISG